LVDLLPATLTLEISSDWVVVLALVWPICRPKS
jgi:hypothetical protein